jgi:hypothetical protein
VFQVKSPACFGSSCVPSYDIYAGSTGRINNVLLGSGGNSVISGAVGGGGVVNLQNAASDSFSFTSYSGTTANPVFLFNGQPSGTIDLLRFQKNGYTQVDIDNTGNVGIGTLAPVARLEVSGAGTSAIPSFMISSATTLHGDYLVVTSAGNVGIGSSAPLTKLEIKGASRYIPVALTVAGAGPYTVATDASLSNSFTLTATQTFTLSNPTNATDGQRVIWRIKQDGTGSRLISLDTNFRLGADITVVTLSTGANKVDYLGAIYNSTDGKWDVIAFIKGY